MGVYVKSLVFFLLAPGLVAGLLPRLILASGLQVLAVQLGPLRFAGMPLILAGACLVLAGFWCFAGRGRGTPAPVDPPRELVTSGPYRYTRNPMYLGVVSVLLGQALVFESPALLLYTLFCLLAFHTRVVCREEAELADRFGEAYVRYRATVPRWLPGFFRGSHA